MKQYSFTADSVEEVLSKISDTIKNRFKPTVGIIFSSVRLGIEELAQGLGEFSIDIFGGSSCGEIIVGTGEKKTINEGSAVVSLLDIPPDCYKLKLFKQEEISSFELGECIGRWGIEQFEDFSFIIMICGLKNDGEQVIKGIFNSTVKTVPVYGGLTGDDGMFNKTYVFIAGDLAEQGAVVLALDNKKIISDGIAISGWQGLGSEKTVTRSVNNVVYSIDNQPALELYKKYLGVHEKDLPNIGIEYPLLVKRDDGTEVLRAVIGIDSEANSLIFAGSVPEGAKVRFSSSPGFEPIERVKEDMIPLVNKTREADILLLFSCMARHMALGPMIEEEITETQKKWDCPMTGFFCYGELGKNMAGNFDFYNETFNLVTLKFISDK